MQLHFCFAGFKLWEIIKMFQRMVLTLVQSQYLIFPGTAGFSTDYLFLDIWDRMRLQNILLEWNAFQVTWELLERSSLHILTFKMHRTCWRPLVYVLSHWKHMGAVTMTSWQSFKARAHSFLYWVFVVCWLDVLPVSDVFPAQHRSIHTCLGTNTQ